MVMLRIFRYLTAFCGFCILILCYFIHTVNILYGDDVKNDWVDRKVLNVTKIGRGSGSYNVKNIVAYSLLKQIENDSGQYSCGPDFKFIDVDESRGKNEMWTRVENTELYVFSVHFDTRLRPYYFVRIIAMTRGVSTGDVFCQILTKNRTYQFSKAVITPIWSEEWNQSDHHSYFEPVLISCRVQNDFKLQAVSLTSKPCQPSKNYFKIKQNKKRHINFTVCVKPLSFDLDISEKLIQWIQINDLLGADKIIIYYYSVRKKTEKLLQWLDINHKKVEIKYFKPIKRIMKRFDQVNELDVKTVWQRRKYEIISYNDCFYHNLNSDYVIPLDIDEIIVPKRENNWRDLFDSLSGALKGHFASFSVRNAYYFQESDNKTENEPVFFFRYTSRSKLSDREESGKSFISARNSLTVFNHYTLHTLKPGVSRIHFMSSSLVQLNHYKKNCSIVILPECEKYISSQRFVDSVMFKYKRDFYHRHRNLIKQLKLDGVL